MSQQNFRGGGGFGNRPGGHGQGHAPPPGQGPDPIAQLLIPSPKLPVYFAGNESNAPRRELFDGEARAVAEKLKTFPASQLRRFYGAVTALRQQLDLDKTIADEFVRARMAQLKAHAAYTLKRDRNYPGDLLRFFTDHAEAVKGRHDFLLGFQPHFEAVIAYHKVFEVKKGDRA